MRVVQETAETLYLVLPSASSPVSPQSGKLSDEDLEAVAGGGEAGREAGMYWL